MANIPLTIGRKNNKIKNKGVLIMTNYLIRRNNLKNYYFLEEAINSFFKPAFFEQKHSLMKTDVRENEMAYLMDVEIPGFDKKEISLSFEKGYLTISAEKQESSEENEK